MAKKTPKWEGEIEGYRCRVYATRDSYLVLLGDKELDDDDADVWEMPKLGNDPSAWAHQAVLNQKASEKAGG